MGNVSGNRTWTLHALEPGAYRWVVRAVDNAFNGSPRAEGTFFIGSTTDADVVSPRSFALSPAYPSPFNRETRITLALIRQENVAVAVYDVQGHRVAVVHDGPLAPGHHSLTFRAGDLPSGIYFVQGRGQGQTASRRVTLLR